MSNNIVISKALAELNHRQEKAFLLGLVSDLKILSNRAEISTSDRITVLQSLEKRENELKTLRGKIPL